MGSWSHQTPAYLGWQARKRFGIPPRSWVKFVQMVQERFSVEVLMDPGLPPFVRGVLLAERQPNGVRALILVSPSAPHPRWVVAHELGHLTLGATYALEFCLAGACEEMTLPKERGANDWAACWLLSIDDIYDQGQAGWGLGQMSLRDDVPPAVPLLRVELAYLLREFSGSRYRELQSALNDS